MFLLLLCNRRPLRNCWRSPFGRGSVRRTNRKKFFGRHVGFSAFAIRSYGAVGYCPNFERSVLICRNDCPHFDLSCGSTHVTKVDEYRNKAENCERLAQKAKDVDAKELLQEAARSWRQLEATAERNGL